MGTPNISRINVSDNAVPLATQPKGCILFTNVGGNTVFLGGSGVTFQTGFPLLSGASIEMESCDDWYGVCQPATSSSVAVLINTKAGLFFLGAGQTGTFAVTSANIRTLSGLRGGFADTNSSSAVVVSPFYFETARWAVVGSAGAIINATATERLLITFLTLTTASTSAGWGNNGGTHSLTITLGILKRFSCRAALAFTTQVRVWIGLADVNASAPTNGGTMRSDAPAANFVGFRYSTNAGDTTFQCVVQTAALNQTVVDSHVAADLNIHLFEFTYVNGSISFQIDGVQVALVGGPNVPAVGQGLDLGIFVDNVAVAQQRGVTMDYIASFV